MKKLLMIAYSFPPTGGMASIRALKFVQYLPRYGWEPIVLTVKKGKDKFQDYSLMQKVPEGTKVLKTASWEVPMLKIQNLRSWLRREKTEAAFGKKGSQSRVKAKAIKLLEDLGKMLAPLPDRRIGWLPFAVYTGLGVAKAVDVIFATAKPFTDLLIGYLLKHITGKPLVVEFRDPWSLNVEPSPPTKLHKKVSRYLEHMVLGAATRVVVTSDTIKEGFMALYPEVGQDKYITITNGFDPEDFATIVYSEQSAKDKLTITHTGSFYGFRTPRALLNALRRLIDEHEGIDKEIEVVFVGSFDQDVEMLVKQLKLERVVRLVGPVSYSGSLAYQMKADVLLLLFAPDIDNLQYFNYLPGKIFEYMAAQKPILALIPPSAAANLIESAKVGILVAYEDIEAIKQSLHELYLQHLQGGIEYKPNEAVVNRYTRQALTMELAKLLDRMVDRR